MLAKVAAVVTILWVSVASAAPRRVVLINGNTLLRKQVEIALLAWELEVTAVESAPVAPQMPRAALRAKEVATQYGASGVVWIGELNREYSLWFYDAALDQAVTRPLGSGEPTDAETAAGLALSVKTLLRSSTIAPERERIAVRPRGHFRLEATGGGQLLTDVGGDFDLRLGASVSWWPSGDDGMFGLAAGVRTGPGSGVDHGAFSGRFGDTSIEAGARARLPTSAGLQFEPSLGMSLHLTALDGALSMPSGPVHQSFVDPALDAAVVADVPAGERLHVGALVGLSYFLLNQRYLVLGTPVAEVAPVQVQLGLRLSFAVD